MGTRVEHLKMADENRRFAHECIAGDLAGCDGNLRWGVVSAYYAGLHYAHAVCSTSTDPTKQHPEDHTALQQAFRTLVDQAAAQALSSLMSMSFKARYLDGQQTLTSWFEAWSGDSELAAAEMAMTDLRVVQEASLRYLGTLGT